MNEGDKIHKLARELWPINRSITGNGLRKSLRILKKIVKSLRIYEVKSGTKIFDWIIPNEWNVKNAWIKNYKGKKIIDFKNNNLHLVNYSIPINKKISFQELKKHIHTIPNLKKAIPYVTSYYDKNWGFCISHEEFKKLDNNNYHVFIDSSLKKGSLSYGEILIKGKVKKEIFLSTYICHPSMANNELSGPCVLIFIAKWILSLKNRYYSYRIIFIPETIGSLTYLRKNLKILKKNVIAGFNITCFGDERNYSYIPSRNGNTLADLISKHILFWTDKNFKKYTWLDRGSDERQYCWPGIDLPLVTLMRSKFDTFKEYHNSMDNLDNIVTPKGLKDSFILLKRIINGLENNFYYKVNILGEPYFSKYGLYPKISNKNSNKRDSNYKFLRNILSYCDGYNSLLDISRILNTPIWDLYEPINLFIKLKIISKAKKIN